MRVDVMAAFGDRRGEDAGAVEAIADRIVSAIGIVARGVEARAVAMPGDGPTAERAGGEQGAAEADEGAALHVSLRRGR